MRQKIAAVLLSVVLLLFCGACTVHSSDGDDSSVATSEGQQPASTEVRTKTFTSPGMGLRITYDSDWYIDIDDTGPYFEILYSAQAKAKVYLLNQSINLDTLTESVFAKLLEDNYSSDWVGYYKYNVTDTANYLLIQNDQMSKAQMTAKIKLEYYDGSTYSVELIPNTVTWYFANLENGGTIFIQYEDYEEDDTIAQQLDENFNGFVGSIECVSKPASQTYAYSLDDEIKIN